MNETQENKLGEIVAELDTFIENMDNGSMYLETVFEDGVLEINGNEEGLMKFAIQVLKLANSRTEGSHFNYDEASMLSACDLPFEVRFQSFRA